MDTLKCPECGFENHTSCRFCIQCGTSLAEAEPAPAGEPGEPEPYGRPEVARPDTEELLRRIVEESGYEHSSARAGWKVTVPLAQERRQVVYVMFNGKDDDGKDIVSFLSVCGDADEGRAMDLLRFNTTPSHGAFGLKTIRGRDYFVVTANQLADTADPDELRSILLHVARRADSVEEQLRRGDDVF
jgi:hypothetical protein